ncbi:MULTISPECIES: dipeptidase [Sphingobium]|uniref:dipeptidase n=1 Tax=Sphingobium TaxID=165695 RepID=UPI000C0783C2|nr:MULTISPECIES: dipeptidase [Sphingobium]MDV3479715.1 dipeptidase [Sphingobium yanoikuyae]PHP20208.1 peptidase M19 [Sphingobium sp. IP1]
MRKAVLTIGSFLLASVSLPALATPDARQAHEGMIVLDTHFDTPANLGRPEWNIMDRHVEARDGDQVDFPRMVDGGVDGGFFAIFTASGPRTPDGDRAARDFAIRRGVQIREMIAKHADSFALAITADDAEAAVKQGKRFVFLSMENGYPFERDISLMSAFRSLGVTMMSPVHTKNNDLADSSTDKPEWNGLSPAGKAYVAEANRLGILIDLSHASDAVVRQTVALSKAPIILSHSGMRGVFDHPRNIPDAEAKLIAQKGGVIQINAFNAYMIATPKIPEREAALKDLMAGFMSRTNMSAAERRTLIAKRKEIDAKWPVPQASFDDLMKHILHAIKLVGIDHIGISGDFDGGGGIEGFRDITDFPKVTAALLKAGYKAEDIAGLWGGNALRVLRAAQAGAEPGTVPAIPFTN